MPILPVLTAKHFDRRWRDCNLECPSSQSTSDEDEKSWRSELSTVLASLHTLGGIADANFEVVESSNAVSLTSARKVLTSNI